MVSGEPNVALRCAEDVAPYNYVSKALIIAIAFLERNAISKAQYDKSLGDLIEKMGMQDII